MQTCKSPTLRKEATPSRELVNMIQGTCLMVASLLMFFFGAQLPNPEAALGTALVLSPLTMVAALVVIARRD